MASLTERPVNPPRPSISEVAATNTATGTRRTWNRLLEGCRR